MSTNEQVLEKYRELRFELEAMEAEAKKRGISLIEPASEATERPLTIAANGLVQDFLKRLNDGELSRLFELDDALTGYEIGFGLISVLGAPPGAGKTGLAMQCVFEALRFKPDLRVVIANAESSFDVLLRRELCRQTRIESAKVRFGDLNDDEMRQVIKAAAEIQSKLGNVEVLQEPCTSLQLLRLLDSTPGFLVVDYLQKFAPPDKDIRIGVGEVMATLRTLAKAGWAVLALSATARTNGKGGSKHDSSQLNQASFRDSGEIEFNADSAYILIDNGEVDEKPYIRNVTLSCVKNRHAMKKDFDLIFHMPRMEFTRKPDDEVDLSGFESDSEDNEIENDFKPWKG